MPELFVKIYLKNPLKESRINPWTLPNKEVGWVSGEGDGDG